MVVQAEQKRRVEEYKARRAEEEARREAEEAERERQEAELRRQQTQDLARFQQRVRIHQKLSRTALFQHVAFTLYRYDMRCVFRTWQRCAAKSHESAPSRKKSSRSGGDWRA